MAEALLRHALREQEEISVESAGLGAMVDWPASEHSEVLMAERGLDIAPHRARQLTPAMIRDADLILVMESGHKKAIEAEDATARGKVFRLGEWRDVDIDDPFQKPKTAYEDALVEIDASVADWVERLLV
jgi:protein-tyrosine phosphatase